MIKLSSIVIVLSVLSVLSVLLSGCDYRMTPVHIKNLTKLCGEPGVNYYYRASSDSNYYARCNNGAVITVSYTNAQAWSKALGK